MFTIQKQNDFLGYNSLFEYFNKQGDYMSKSQKFFLYFDKDKRETKKPNKVTKEDIQRLLKSDYDETLEGKEVSKEDYWEYYYEDTPYEWKNGKIEVKPLCDYLSSLVSGWFYRLLVEYQESYNFQIVKDEIGFEMCLQSGDRIRKPDLALIGPNSLQIQLEDIRYHGTCDVCIEFISDSTQSEVERDTKIKKEEYEEAGVKEYFIIDRKGEHTAFYRLEDKVYKNIGSADGIISSDVLKGFQFRIKDLYSQPDFKELVDDPVYRDFIYLDYQQSEERAQQAEKRTQQAEKRAQQAEKRIAEEKKRSDNELLKYKKMLEDLGVTM